MTDYTGLTSEQARLIRKADAICFDFNTTDGIPAIRAITRPNDSTGTGEITHTIPVSFSRTTCFDGASGPDTSMHCFAMVMSAQHTPEWRTVVNHIRKGSVVGFHWHRGNASPVTTAAGLVVDYLNVIVGNNTFRVETYIGPPDSPTRMVRVS